MAIIGRLQKNLVNFGDKILFEQFLCGRLYRTGRSKTVPFDEIGRCNTLGFALPGDGIKQLLLLFGNVRQNLPENRIVRSNHIIDGSPDRLQRTFVAFGRIGKRFVEGLLDIVGVPLKSA